MNGHPGKGFRVTNLVVAVVFLVSAAIQWNDPDPLPWIAVYGGAAAASIAVGRFRGARVLPALVGLVALVWAGTMAGRVFADLAFADLFKSMKAETPSIEHSRELLGLLIIAAWMAVLVVAGARGRTERTG